MKKILVVDDEKPISDIIKFNMSREGYEVVKPLTVAKPWSCLKQSFRILSS